MRKTKGIVLLEARPSWINPANYMEEIWEVIRTWFLAFSTCWRLAGTHGQINVLNSNESNQINNCSSQSETVCMGLERVYNRIFWHSKGRRKVSFPCILSLFFSINTVREIVSLQLECPALTFLRLFSQYIPWLYYILIISDWLYWVNFMVILFSRPRVHSYQ